MAIVYQYHIVCLSGLALPYQHLQPHEDCAFLHCTSFHHVDAVFADFLYDHCMIFSFLNGKPLACRLLFQAPS